MTRKEKWSLIFWRSIAMCMMSLVFVAGCRSVDYTSAISERSPMERRPSIYVDEERLANLGRVPVGEIPASATNLMEYLVWINECADRAGLPQECHLGFSITEVRRWSVNMINADMIIRAVSEEPVWFHELGIDAPKENSIKHDLRERNMRELLWLLRGVYSLQTQYDVAGIILGYGWSWNHMITLQKQNGKGEEASDSP